MLINSSALFAQQGFSITGANINSSTGSMSYTIGIFPYESYSNTEAIITQGIQHPMEIQTKYTFDEKDEIDLYCKVFPNPTSDLVSFTIDNYAIEDVSYIFANHAGETLRTGEIIGNKACFSVKDLPSGIYLLKISDNNSKIKTYKVIKQ